MAQTHSGTFSVLLRNDGLTYSVTDQEGKFLVLQQYRHKPVLPGDNWNIPASGYFQEMAEMSWLSAPYARVNVAVSTHKISLLPLSYMQDEGPAALMALMHKAEKGESLLTAATGIGDMALSTLVPAAVSSFAARFWPETKITSAEAVYLTAIIRRYGQTGGRQVFLHLFPDSMLIVVMQSDKLLFANAFQYASQEDVLYYLVYVLDQLGFVPTEEQLWLSGEIFPDTEIFRLLSTYFGKVGFLGGSENGYANPDSRHFLIQALAQCAS